MTNIFDKLFESDIDLL